MALLVYMWIAWLFLVCFPFFIAWKFKIARLLGYRGWLLAINTANPVSPFFWERRPLAQNGRRWLIGLNLSCILWIAWGVVLVLMDSAKR